MEIVKYIVYKNKNYDAINCALIEAASKGHIEVVKFLISEGANIHLENDCVLRWAASNGNLEVVKYLVSKGADIHVINEEALRIAAHNNHIEVVRYFLELGANIDIAIKNSSIHGKTLLNKFQKP